MATSDSKRQFSSLKEHLESLHEYLGVISSKQEEDRKWSCTREYNLILFKFLGIILKELFTACEHNLNTGPRLFKYDRDSRLDVLALDHLP